MGGCVHEANGQGHKSKGENQSNNPGNSDGIAATLAEGGGDVGDGFEGVIARISWHLWFVHGSSQVCL